jgi:hypothetical protein
MRFCVYLLCKALSAAVHRTSVGFIIRMGPKMVQEIVPSHKGNFRAVFMQAFQNSIVSFGLGIIEFLYHEVLRVWNDLIFTSQVGLGKIEVFA